MKKLFFLAIAGLLSVMGVQAQRVADHLNRGLVAIPQGDKTGQDSRYGTSGTGIFVSWRKLATEYFDTQYNLYRNGTKVASNLTVTNYQDNNGTKASLYKVVPVVRGQERQDLASAEVKPWEHQYWDIAVQPVVGRDGVVTNGYTLHDCSVADVDGDGQMEFVVKRRNDSGNLLSASNKNNFNLHECYKMDGTRLWWIDMGPNLMAGPDEQFDLILYDWDQDGKAEALMRGADNMIIHTATGKTIKIGNMNYYAPRDEYTKQGAEYLLYMNGETGEPYGWDGSDSWTPAAYPLPRFESGESDYATVWGANDTGHRATKHYFGAPYLDGRNPSIFLGRGCYTRHKFCALDVNPATHELTQRWRWNCYDGKSPWFGNGFHNFCIADVDMDGRDEIVFGSMIIDDTGYGLSTTGYGHGDSQHCGDLDPYRWGLELFVCLESAASPGVAYTNAMRSEVYYQNGGGGDNGRCMAGNFQSTYPGGVARSAQGGLISLVADKVVENDNHMANDDYWNMRVFWDGDLLDEFMDSPGVERSPCVYKYGGQAEVGTGRSAYPNDRCWMGEGNLNNSSKNNPGFLGDIIGDWREEIVVRAGDALRIYVSSYESPWAVTTLWADHEYRNAMTWQSVGYNQAPHPSFFLGELEGITKEPPAVVLEGRTEVSGTIQTTDEHLLISGYEDKTVSVADGASPWILTVNTPAWVQGSGAKQATASTPKQPARTIINYTTTLTGGAFGGATHLVKQGEGTLVLRNVVQKHTGATDVWNGTLQFDGTMESSPVWLNRHTTLLSDGGKFLGGLKAEYNATIYPGGKDKVGTITVSALELGFGSRIAFDVTDPSTLDYLHADQLSIETKTWQYGPKYKAPVWEFKTAGTLAEGTYEIGSIGSVTGNVEDIILEGLGNDVVASLSHENGKLLLLVKPMRESTTVVWNGTQGDNLWEQASGENFLADGQHTYAANGDDVVFDDNAAITTVNIKGAVSPKSVTFNNETKAYVINGDSIVGAAPIVKNGKGRVTFNNWNNTGATTINGGTVVVTMLANNAGQTIGSLGKASQPINLNDGATLQTNGTIITDQILNLTGEATVDVPSGKSVIFNKAIKGNGSTLVKTGAGSMETGTSGNTYSKLIVKAGTVTSNYSSNNVDQLPATVEFQGGTLWGANQEGGSGVTNNANFVVPQGKTGSFYGSFRGVYKGSLSGAGTFNVYSGGVRCYWQGDWSAFTGTVKVGKQNRQNKKSYQPGFDFQNAYGLPNATLSVNEGVLCSCNSTFVVGKVSGSGTLTGSGTWVVGANDDDFYLNTEIGVTSDRTDDYGGTIAKSATKLTKRGTGKMSVMTVGKINATLTVEGGTVAFNQAALSTLVCGTNPATVKNGGRIVGQGLLNSVALQSGAVLIPCGSINNETTPGIIKTNALLNVQKGATVDFLLNGSKNSQLQPANLSFNGTVKVTLVGGFVPTVGQEFTLWTTAGNFSGTPEFSLPQLPEGLYWNTDGLRDKTGVLRVTDNPADGIGRIGMDDVAYCEVYSVDGKKMASLTVRRADLRSALHKMGVQPGVYVVKSVAGRNSQTETLVLKKFR